jgi:hypothetical protein
MKKLLLLVLIAMQHIHGLRPISDASIRFQESLNDYLRNKTSVNAQKVVAEYDSTENSDKYRRTFDSTLSINRLNIDQLRGRVTTPAQTAQTPQPRSSSRPVGRTSTPEEPIKGSDIIIDRVPAQPIAGSDTVIETRSAQPVPADNNDKEDKLIVQTTNEIKLPPNSLPVNAHEAAKRGDLVATISNDRTNLPPQEKVYPQASTDRVVGSQMKDPYGTAARLRQRSTHGQEEQDSVFQDESHERTFISTEEQHNKARYDAELDAQIQAAERAREEAELNEHNERELRQRAADERMMQRQMEVNER